MRSHNVVVCEEKRVAERIVHMCLCREMKHRVDAWVLQKDLSYRGHVSDVHWVEVDNWL